MPSGTEVFGRVIQSTCEKNGESGGACYLLDSHESTYSYLVEIEPIPPRYEQHAFIVAVESPDPKVSVSSGIDAMDKLKKEVIASKHRWPIPGAGRGRSYHHLVEEWRG